ncbi:flap endonuclease-1 [Candidatus Woesearchaeota archaeon]|nr:flap endonuclease-1 [Candidatus Woesearchaeota archaeon]MCF8013987.1 flap endonuclease-1 [Candidatus Woesearchaeota archaeon]
MGVAITELLEGKEVKPEELSGKILAVDAFNTLYMFLTTIRGADGSPLMDSKGNITSHLQGLFGRFSNLMEKGLKFVFVFDGQPPELKTKERERRKALKEEAKELYEEAKQKEDVENMKKYAARTVFLTKEMIVEAKELLFAMGIPYVEAPSEGEAQAAFMVKKGDAYAVVSQDADSLISGSPRTIKNLSISRRRKMPGSYNYQVVNPELLSLKDNLERLELSQDELIALAILIGTDYNYGGVKGIGPKKGIKLVKKHKGDFNALFEEAKWSETFDFDWRKIFEVFKQMPVKEDYVIEFKNYDKEKLINLLVKKCEFNEDRVNSTLDKLDKAKKLNEQKGLGDFF